jgi:hypothetical protein
MSKPAHSKKGNAIGKDLYTAGHHHLAFAPLALSSLLIKVSIAALQAQSRVHQDIDPDHLREVGAWTII